MKFQYGTVAVYPAKPTLKYMILPCAVAGCGYTTQRRAKHLPYITLTNKHCSTRLHTHTSTSEQAARMHSAHHHIASSTQTEETDKQNKQRSDPGRSGCLTPPAVSPGLWRQKSSPGRSPWSKTQTKPNQSCSTYYRLPNNATRFSKLAKEEGAEQRRDDTGTDSIVFTTDASASIASISERAGWCQFIDHDAPAVQRHSRRRRVGHEGQGPVRG